MKRTLSLFAIILMSIACFAQPEMIKELPAHSDHYVELNNKLYFAIDDELWTSNGTTNGTVKVIDLNEVILDIKVAGNSLFITTFSSGNKLYISNGTLAGTTALTGPVFSGVPNNFTLFNGKVFFITYSGTNELWVTDGTAAGTGFYSDVSSEPSSSLTVFNTCLYFVSDKKLWKTHSSALAPTMVLQPSDFPENMDGVNSNGFTLDNCVGIINNKLIFSTTYFDLNAFNQVVKLYSTTGDVGDFTAIKEVAAVNYVARSEMLNGSIVISFYGESSVLHPVWITDGTEAGTQELLADVGTDAYTEKLILVGNKLVLAVSGQSVNYLYLTDGTPSGSGYFQALKAGGPMRNFASADSKLFFSDHLVPGDYGSGDGLNDWELWQSDLTNAGTNMVRDLTPNSSDKYFGSDNLICINGVVYFSTGDGNYGWSNEQLPDVTPRLWKYCEPFATEVITSSIQHSDGDLSIFPNPFVNKLNIGTIEGGKVHVYNTMGDVVFQENNYSGPLDLSMLSEGVYSVKVEGYTQSYKVVKLK